MITDNHVYYSRLSIEECIKRITDKPWEFESYWKLFVLWYKCQTVSPTQLLITFTGGQFAGTRRTKYLISFSTKGEVTVIHVDFRGELLGFPPFTPSQELDAFIREKVYGVTTIEETVEYLSDFALDAIWKETVE